MSEIIFSIATFAGLNPSFPIKIGVKQSSTPKEPVRRRVDPYT